MGVSNQSTVVGGISVLMLAIIAHFVTYAMIADSVQAGLVAGVTVALVLGVASLGASILISVFTRAKEGLFTYFTGAFTFGVVIGLVTLIVQRVGIPLIG